MSQLWEIIFGEGGERVTRSCLKCFSPAMEMASRLGARISDRTLEANSLLQEDKTRCRKDEILRITPSGAIRVTLGACLNS